MDIEVLTRFEAARERIPVITEASDCGKFDVGRFNLEPDRPPFHRLAGESLAPRDPRGISTDNNATFLLDVFWSGEGLSGFGGFLRGRLNNIELESIGQET